MTSYNLVPQLGKSSHSVGKIVLKRSKVDKASLICLDGQQRLTTVSLLAAVFRDEALKELAALEGEVGEQVNNVKNRLSNLVEQLEGILYINGEANMSSRYTQLKLYIIGQLLFFIFGYLQSFLYF